MQVTGLFHVADQDQRSSDADGESSTPSVLRHEAGAPPGFRVSRRLDRGGGQHTDHSHLCRRAGGSAPTRDNFVLSP